MLRKFLLFIGWASIIGSFFDGVLWLHSMWLIIMNESVSISISLDEYLKNHVGFIYWVKQLAFYVLPDGLVIWLFNLPSLIYFPVRMIISVIIGWWALKKAKELDEPFID